MPSRSTRVRCVTPPRRSRDTRSMPAARGDACAAGSIGICRALRRSRRMRRGSSSTIAPQGLSLAGLSLRNVARDLRCPDNRALAISDRRHRHGDVDQRAVFAAPDRLERFYGFPSRNLFEHAAFLDESVRRNQKRDADASSARVRAVMSSMATTMRPSLPAALYMRLALTSMLRRPRCSKSLSTM